MVLFVEMTIFHHLGFKNGSFIQTTMITIITGKPGAENFVYDLHRS